MGARFTPCAASRNRRLTKSPAGASGPARVVREWFHFHGRVIRARRAKVTRRRIVHLRLPSRRLALLRPKKFSKTWPEFSKLATILQRQDASSIRRNGPT